MRIIFWIAIILAVAVAAPVTTEVVDKQISIKMDMHEDSPIGLYMEGLFDPKDEGNNKLQAFLKLANQYIPILESLANASNDLTYERTWRVQFVGVDVIVDFYLQLIIGWKVTPGQYFGDSYDITYTPFAHGVTYIRGNGTTWPYYGSLGAGTRFITFDAPVGVQLFKEGKICFGGQYILDSIHAGIHMEGAPKQCADEIIDNLIDGVPIHLDCEYISPVNITLVDVNFTDPHVGEFIPQTCFDF
mmetsp:Transcript_38865/g.70778  ORF Transcript_38865/g.70778 Transcript_38865/m.70778 type:complete len:245 (+) Transcript_38865:1-735(+)